MDKPEIRLAVELAMELRPDNGRRLLEALAANAALREFDKSSAIDLAARLLQQDQNDFVKQHTGYGVR